MKWITIIIVDDNDKVRHGIRMLLENEPGFMVVDESTNGIDAIRLVKQLQPDVLIVDIVMSGLSGLQVIKQVKKIAPKTASVVFSMHNNEAYVSQALKDGAKAYILKGTPPDDLLKGIREAANGRTYLSLGISQKELDIYQKNVEGTN